MGTENVQAYCMTEAQHTYLMHVSINGRTAFSFRLYIGLRTGTYLKLELIKHLRDNNRLMLPRGDNSTNIIAIPINWSKMLN